MRLLASVLVIFAFVWGGYWYVGSSAVEAGVKTWIEDARRGGLDVQASEISVQGFPNRFDTTFTNVVLSDAASGITWQAPFFQSFALSYKPWHMVAVWPHVQKIAFQGLELEIGSEDMRASLILTPDIALTLDRARFSATGLNVTLPPDTIVQVTGGSITAQRVFAATRQNLLQDRAHDLSVEIADIALPPDIMAALDTNNALPDTITSAIIDATFEFDGEIGALSASAGIPGLRAVNIRKGEIRWQELSLGISGRLTPGPFGVAQGELELTSNNWREVFAVLAAAGLVDPVWEGAIAPLALADGNPSDLKTTLTYQDGVTWFGPLALGPAPVLFVN